MTFIDTHTHLYDERLTSDLKQIENAIDAGVLRMYMPNCDSNTIKGMLAIADKYPDNCFPSIGLHPCYVKNDFEIELSIVDEWLKKRKFYAIGEIGLDYYWDTSWKNQQIKAFEYQIELAKSNRLPIIIHSRESTRDCIDIVRAKQNGSLKGIFHCFSGTIEEAQEIADLGFHIGIGGVVTYSKSTLPEVVKEIPLENIVLETDAPYLAPVPNRGKRNESAYLPIIAKKISDLKAIDLEKVAEITTRNANVIFQHNDLS